MDINLWHNNYFTLLNKEKRLYLKFGGLLTKYVIIHPHFHFKSTVWKKFENPDYETKIYFNKFVIDEKSFDIKQLFDILKEISWRYLDNEDDILWYETGFWNAIINDKSYFGVGIETLINFIEKHKDCKYAICFSNPESLFSIYKDIQNDNTFIFEIFVNNELGPFAEVIEPFQKTLFNMNAILTNKKLLPESEIRQFYGLKKPIIVKPVAYLMDKDYKRIPVIVNPFKKSPFFDIKRIKLIYGSARGGFIESEYNKRYFFTNLEIWLFDNITLLELIFDPARHYNPPLTPQQQE